MSKRHKNDCCVPAEVIDRLYEVRRQLIWLSFRLPDEIYSDDQNREGMAQDLGYLAEEIEWIMATFCVDLSSDYFRKLDLPAEIEQTSLGKRWRKFWISKGKKVSGRT